MEGGCANDYTYVHGDPVNTFDLSGQISCKSKVLKVLVSVFSIGGWVRDPKSQVAQETVTAATLAKFEDAVWGDQHQPGRCTAHHHEVGRNDAAGWVRVQHQLGS